MTAAVAPRATASEPVARPPAEPAVAAPAAEPRALPHPAAKPAAGGVLVAVCGLEPRAGTTLLAWLLAHEAHAAGERPVLLAQLPGGDGLAALPALGDGELGPVVAGASELRAARRDHACVVVDCGLLADAGAQAVLTLATHVVWTVPAGADAGTTATALLLDGELAPPPGDALELLAVVATRPAAVDAGEQRALREVVAVRGERLVLIPHVRALAGARESGLRTAPKRLAGAVAAIAGVLRREPPP